MFSPRFVSLYPYVFSHAPSIELVSLLDSSPRNRTDYLSWFARPRFLCLLLDHPHKSGHTLLILLLSVDNFPSIMLNFSQAECLGTWGF